MTEIIGENKIISSVYDEPFWRLMKTESRSTGEQLWFRILNEKYDNDEVLLDHFFHIAHFSSTLNHPQIPKITDYGSKENINYISMHHFQGKPLVNLVTAGKPFDEKRAIKIAVQIAQILQFAKLTGTAHGCLSANSVFVNSDDKIALIDFGSGDFFDFLFHEKNDCDAFEHACYLSPQRLKQDSVANSGGDLYSLGIIFFFMLSGRLPFKADKLSKIISNKESARPSFADVNSHVSPGVENIVYRLIDPNPQFRFPSISHFLREIAPETVSKDALPDPEFVNEPVTIREKMQNRFDRLPPVLQNIIPTWVGSKRRLAVAVLAIFILVFIIFLLALSSGFDSSKNNNANMAYQEYLSQPNETENRVNEQPEQIEQETTPIISAPVEIPQETEEIVEDLLQKPPNDNSEKNIDNDEQVKIIALEGSGAGEPFLMSVNVKGMPVKAAVFLDEKEIGSTGEQGNLDISGLEVGKRYRFRVEKPGFRVWDQWILIDSETMGGLELEMIPEADVLRRFVVDNVEFADRVIIDNKLPSHTLPCEIDLPPGVHTLKYVESNSMFSLDTTIFLGMDSPARLFVDAKSLGSGSLSVVVQNAIQVGYAYVSVDSTEKLRTTPLRLNLPAGEHKVIIFREGYTPVPQDTTVIILPNRQSTLRCRLIPNS